MADLASDAAAVDKATVAQLGDMAHVLLYGHVPLTVPLAAEAIAKAETPRERMIAHWLAGCMAAGDSSDVSAGLEHFAVAEPLARELGEHLYLGSVERGRGIVQAGDGGDLERSLLRAALDAYARRQRAPRQQRALHDGLGHRRRGRNVRCRGGVGPGGDRVRPVGGQPARARHATIALTGLTKVPDPVGAVHDSLGIFRASGDLRYVARCYLQLADLVPSESAAMCIEALSASALAGDLDRWRPTIAEGRARGVDGLVAGEPPRHG